MKKPFFSIVIPTYNRADIILKTVHSILNQSFKDFEIIIVDDGSSDNTKDIIQTIQDPRVIYFYKKNEERGAARNYGTKKSSGKYVFFMDSDDHMDDLYLLRSSERIIKDNYPAWYHSRFSTINENHSILYSKPIIGKSIKNKIKNRNYFACAVFLRIDIAKEYEFIENHKFNFGEDWYLWLRLNQRFPLSYSNEIHYYQMRETNRSKFNANSIQDIIDNKNIMLAALSEDPKTNYSTLLNKVKAQYYSLIALEYVLQGNSKKALQFITSAIFLNPIHLIWRKTYSIIIKTII